MEERTEGEKGAVQPKIMVIGVGGGGCNTISRLKKSESKGVFLVAVNTDIQVLSGITEEGIKKIQIGPNETGGLGCGADPKLGERALEESKAEIIEILEGMDMVFVAAGMGGGTGTGAAPQIAKTAKEMGILTIGVVSKPFSFEGKRREKNAQEGIKKMRENTDSIIILPNEKLIELNSGERCMSLEEAFEESDRVLGNSIMGITNLITQKGQINLDFADIKAVLKNGGDAFIGFGKGEGEEREIQASEAATQNILTECQISGAKRVIYNIVGNNISVQGIQKIGDTIRELVDTDANLILGTAPNQENDQIEITIIAASCWDEEEKEPEEKNQPQDEKVDKVVDHNIETSRNGTGSEKKSGGELTLPGFLQRPE
uniref:Cell division protein FtsZ n=1 Tax=candidate division CPR3 bacterium TaxID=2268181 RepID=A0A7C4RA17_UNCC3